MTETNYFNLLLGIPPLLIAVILHEMAHGYVAEKLGDPTARSLGRISFNPLVHIDPVMTIILPGLLILSGSPVVFGGAKPVPVNPAYFRNPLKGMAIVAAAGPISNILLALAGYLVTTVMGRSGALGWFSPDTAQILLQLMFNWIIINIVLAVFNLVPVPPLDGGRIVTGLLPPRLAIIYAKTERLGLLIVFALLYFGLANWFIAPVLRLVVRSFMLLSGVPITD